MKHLLITLTLASLCLSTKAQPNEKLQALEKNFSKQEISLIRGQMNTGERIHHTWRYIHSPYNKDANIRNQKIIAALDTIRQTFHALSPFAAESYLYENHKSECDTVRFSLILPSSNNDTTGIPETALFRHVRGHNQDDSDDSGFYHHTYDEKNPLPIIDVKSFDFKVFEAIIDQYLKSIMKQTGLKIFPVYWKHDKGYYAKTRKEVIYAEYNTINGEHDGLVTGTHYFIPCKDEKDVRTIYATLDSITYDYINRHPEQLYKYEFIPLDIIQDHRLRELVNGRMWTTNLNNKYALAFAMTEDGFHILSIFTQREQWIPAEWPKLKSWVNGKKTYLKGMKP